MTTRVKPYITCLVWMPIGTVIALRLRINEAARTVFADGYRLKVNWIYASWIATKMI